MTASPATGRSPLVTVVILSYVDGRHRLLPCLRDVLAQRDLPPGGMDVLVVHNAPPDPQDRGLDDWAEVREELRTGEFRRVRVIESGQNKGFAGGHNVGFREVLSEFVAILNSDTRPGPTWLSELLAAFDGKENARLGAAASKLVFLPRFLPVRLSTRGFVPARRDPAESDTRELGVRVHEVRVDGRDVTQGVFWGHFGYDQEHAGAERFRWTRPAGTMLVPIDPEGTGSGPAAPLRLTLRLAAKAVEPVEVSWPGGTVEVKTDDRPASVQPTEVEVEVPAGAGLVDQINNVGSRVFADGHGADRGYQEVDEGQYQQAEDVFAFCGAAVCFRSAALQSAGYFDEDFFTYYEDTDLAWRLWSLGWRVRYVPTSVVRHEHSATIGEQSPRWWFHVDRNRLLMLTKNARAGLAAGAVLGYLLDTARWTLTAITSDRRPPAGLWLRLRVVRSYLRLLPRMLRRRRELAGRAVVSRRQLEGRWLVPRDRHTDH
jgi:GT2 family glycosyltransferase